MTGIVLDSGMITIIFGAITAIVSGTVTWAKFKGKMQQFTNAVDDVNKAVQDPAVTEAQFTTIWNDFKVLIQK